jgi:signal transduction protein with GAF and PtsI domain
MHSSVIRVAALSTFCAAALFAQTGGIPPEWEVQKQLSSLAEHVQRIKPVLEQLKPEDWVNQGAPAAYGDQVKRTSAEIEYLIGSTKDLAARPEKLTTALETFFRMQSVDAMLRSVAAGVRKYQNPAIADLLQSMITDTTADRDKLRQYVVELAADREQQFKVMDQEAQRCRASLSRQPNAPGKASDRKEERR